MTLNFYVSYLVPVSPERIQKLEQEISRIEQTLANALALDPSADRKEVDLAISRLRAQMEPERRREPAIMRSKPNSTEWWCPREGRGHCIALIKYGGYDGMSFDAQCKCGAEVHKEELPMSLDLYRMRTRRNDGVEVQPANK